jgi:hypothetical protein
MDAMTGFCARKPGKIADLLDIAILAAHGEDEGECSERHHQIDEHVNRDAAHAGFRVCREANQREAHMTDGRIGHQSFDVLLANGRERAKRHRGDSDEDDDLLPVGRNRLEGTHGDAHQKRHRSHFRGSGKEGRYRRRRAFIDVRRPHMERHGRDLECETCKHEDQTEHEAKLTLATGKGSGNGVEAGVARVAVDQRDAVEQHAGRQSAEHEILQAGLGRAEIVTVDGGQQRRAPATASSSPRYSASMSLAEIISSMPSVDSRMSTGIFKLVEFLRLGKTDRHDERHG